MPKCIIFAIQSLCAWHNFFLLKKQWFGCIPAWDVNPDFICLISRQVICRPLHWVLNLFSVPRPKLIYFALHEPMATSATFGPITL